ncbi:MAG: hypothetical protein AB7P17_15505 [Nitrospirales bacterium]|nr:hypothetical protein [Nitrospirales bacterium]
MKKCFRKEWRLVLLPLLLGTGCATLTDKIHVTVAEPKVYDENMVQKVMASQLAVLGKLESDTEIKPEELLQEYLAELYKRQTETSLGLSPAPASETVQGAQNQTSTKAPSLIGNSVITPPKGTFNFKDSPNTNLSLPSIVRKRAVYGEHILSQKLLYEGDKHLYHNSNYRPILVRMDVSINGYASGESGYFKQIYTGERWEYPDLPHFIVMPFKISVQNSSGKQETAKKECIVNNSSDDNTQNEEGDSRETTDNVFVYSLSPSYDSVVSKESLIEEQIDILTTQLTGFFSGLTGEVNRRDQTAQAEEFLASIEQPLQFGMYSDKKNEFAVAFGPRRVIKKNGYLKNYILWHGPYDISYRFDPGPREIFFIVLAPKDTQCLYIAYETPSEAKVGNLYPYHQMKFSSLKTVSLGTDSVVVNIKNDLFIPLEINPAIEESHLIFSKERVFPDTVVKVGNRFIAYKDTTFLGPHKLEVKLSPLADIKKLKDERKFLADAGVLLINPNGSSRKININPTFIDPPDSQSVKFSTKDNFPILLRTDTLEGQLTVPKNWEIKTIKFGKKGIPFKHLEDGNYFLEIPGDLADTTPHRGYTDVFKVPVSIEYTIDQKPKTETKEVADFLFRRPQIEVR